MLLCALADVLWRAAWEFAFRFEPIALWTLFAQRPRDTRVRRPTGGTAGLVVWAACATPCKPAHGTDGSGSATDRHPDQRHTRSRHWRRSLKLNGSLKQGATLAFGAGIGCARAAHAAASACCASHKLTATCDILCRAEAMYQSLS